MFPFLKELRGHDSALATGSASVASPALPRPGQNEQRMHSSAQRHDLALQCEIRRFQLQMQTGFDDNDEPVVELVSWPFVLPHLLVLQLIL